MLLGINTLHSMYNVSWNHFNFYIQWPFEIMVAKLALVDALRYTILVLNACVHGTGISMYVDCIAASDDAHSWIWH